MKIFRGAALAASALAGIALVPAALGPPAAATAGGAMGGAFGVSVTSSLLGELLPPTPAGASGSTTSTGQAFGPVTATAGPLGLPGVVNVVQVAADTHGTATGVEAEVASRAAITGLSVAAGLLVGADLASTCDATPAAATGSVNLDALVLAGVKLPVTPATNTVIDIPSIAHVVLDEQAPLDVAGGSGIVVRAVHLQVLPTKPGGAVIDVVLGESRCSATAVAASPPRRRPPPGRPPAAALALTPSPSPTPTPSPPETGTPPPAQPTPPAAAPHPTPGGEVRVAPTQGPPGSGLRLSAQGFGGCGEVQLLFDGSPLAVVSPSPGGAVRASDLSVPGAAAVGTHHVEATCRSGIHLVASTSFDVRSARVHRSAFVTSLRTPAEVPTAAVDVVIGVLAAGSTILLAAFPSELFNSTLDENYAEIRGWFGLPPEPAEGGWWTAHPVPVFIAFVLAGGVLFGLLSPGFGLNLSSLALALGLALALVVLTFVYHTPALVHIRTRHGQWGSLKVLPGTALIAAAFVALSRLVHFEPGYAFGLIAGLEFSQDLAVDTTGRLTLGAAGLLLGVGLLAWIARTPLVAAAGRPGASFWVIALEACLAGVFVCALESTVLTLLPLRFLDGTKLTAWSRVAWAAIFGLATLAFIEILLQPASGYLATASSPGQVATAAILFIGFGLFSVAFWGYFRFRPARA